LVVLDVESEFLGVGEGGVEESAEQPFFSLQEVGGFFVEGRSFGR
jgi:hypothetical protein